MDWEALARASDMDFARHLTLRGKNLMFARNIFALLQVDAPAKAKFSDLKRAFTPTVVREIHAAIPDFWPDVDDYERCLLDEASNVTAIYTGTYEPEAVFRAVARHALYSEKIFLIDPLLDPRRIREEFSPIARPEEHRASTMKYSFLWLSLYPWIEAGIVNFVRPLTDFVPGLLHELCEVERKKEQLHPEFRQALEEGSEARVEAANATDGGLTEYYFLSHPDGFFRELYERMPKDSRPKSFEDFLAWIEVRRANHPYYVDRLPGQDGELLHITSGANYEVTKRMCAVTRSHMITDLPARWKEIELDRVNVSNDENWEPFAKALQNAPLKILENVGLGTALKLRSENRLEGMRHFFRKVWKSCREPNQFSRENAENLAAELDDRVTQADTEWKKIDQDLVKWFAAAGAPIITAGFSGWVPAAAAAAGAAVVGAGTLIESHLKRSQFRDLFPAGFFLGLRTRK